MCKLFKSAQPLRFYFSAISSAIFSLKSPHSVNSLALQYPRRPHRLQIPFRLSHIELCIQWRQSYCHIHASVCLLMCVGPFFVCVCVHMCCFVWLTFSYFPRLCIGEFSLCRVNNGGCQDLCLLTSEGRVNCSCRGDRKLLEDNTCIGNTNKSLA